MASNSRLASRRTTPQLAPQTSRITRSQSREPANGPASQMVTRETTRRTRSASAEVERNFAYEPSGNVRTRKRNGVTRLSSVIEDSADRSNDEPSTKDRTDTVLDSPGAASGFSGTTALSQVAEEAADLDPDFIMESLPDLWNEAQKVLKKVVASPDASVEQQANIIRDLKVPGKATSRALHRSLEQLKSLLEDAFHSDNNSYANHEVVLRSLFDDNFATIPPDSKPDDVIFKANLAIFASDVLLSEEGSSKTSEKFQSLDLEFPQLFMSAFKDPKSKVSEAEPGNSILLQDTFRLALDIRTQNAIMLLKSQRHQSSFDPDHTLFQNFLNGSPRGYGTLFDSGSALQQASIRGWQIDGLRDADDSLPLNFRPAVIKRLNEIRRCFSTDPEEMVDFHILETMFSWGEFVSSAAEWISRRHQEIDDHINQYGGEDRIFERISAQREVATTQNESVKSKPHSKAIREGGNAASQPLPERRRATPGAVPASTSALGDSKRRLSGRKFKGVAAAFSTQVSKRKSMEAAQPTQVAMTKEPVLPEGQSAPEIFEDDGWRQLDDDAEEQDTASSDRAPAPTVRDRALRFHQKQYQNKENLVRAQSTNAGTRLKEARPAFIDRQNNAVRVPFDDNSQANTQIVAGSSRNGKRPLDVREGEDEDELDPTQDEGFQTDSRIPDISNRRRIPSSSSHTTKRPRTYQSGRAREVDDDYVPPIPDEGEGEEEEESEEQAPNVTQQAPQSTSYRATAQLAKQLAAALSRPTQRRTPWSAEAENRLIELVGDLGSGYAAIKRMDEQTRNLFAGRDQVALKDKCRTMRFNYHKARQNLPRGFDQIPLKSDQKAYLEAKGIAY